MNQHHKSLSFLMELLIVIFFFTIASSICVLVMSHAKEKQLYAQDIKTSLLYAQNLIDEQSPFLHHETFYIDENGKAKDEKAYYQVKITVQQEGNKGALCEMHVTTQQKETACISFYRQE